MIRRYEIHDRPLCPAVSICVELANAMHYATGAGSDEWPIRYASTPRAQLRPVGDRPDDQRLAALHVAGREDAGDVRHPVRVAGDGAGARSARSPSSLIRPFRSGADESHRQQHEVGVELDRCLGVELRGVEARDAAVGGAREAVGCYRVVPLAAFLVRRRGAEDVRPGRPGILWRARVGRRASTSSWRTLRAPCRCAVPRQSAPVSPPPMMITCLSCALMTRRRRIVPRSARFCAVRYSIAK